MLAPPVSSRLSEGSDVFSSYASKLSLLLDLSPKSRVLLAGPMYCSRATDFSTTFAHVDGVTSSDALLSRRSRHDYDLICLDAHSPWASLPASRIIAAAAECLDSDGSLLVAASNRFSADRVIEVIKRKRSPERMKATPRTIRLALQAQGLHFVEQYLAFPSHERTDEYVLASIRKPGIPASASVLHWAAERVGMYRHVHNDSLFIARRRKFGLATLAETLVSQLDDGTSESGASIGRFAIRERGALIIHLKCDGGEFIARAASNPGVAHTISRNSHFTSRLHSLYSLPDRFRNLIPLTVASLSLYGTQVTVEPRMSGILAWKLRRGSAAAARAREDALSFIDALDAATRRNIVMDSALFDQILGRSLAGLRGRFSAREAADRTIERIDRRLRDLLVGTAVNIVWGHGDFGFGNLLCDPESGRLQGVIDWDTHVEQEFAAVDRFNLLVQNMRVVTDGSIAGAIAKLAETTETHDLIALCVTGVRMVCRSLPYQDEFRRMESLYQPVLEVVDTILGKIAVESSGDVDSLTPA